MSGRARSGRVKRRALWAGAALAVLAVLAVLWLVVVPAGSGPPRQVNLPRGSSAWEAARILKGEGLVRSATATAAAAYVTGKWRHLRAGLHEVGPSMNALEMLDALSRRGTDTWTWLTIPEGYTVRQIARAVQDAGLGSERAVLDAAQDAGRFSTPFPLPGTGLEGYLFPDTYRVDASEMETDILEQMLRRFQEVVWEGLFQGRRMYQGRTLNEIIILASLVEAEAKLPQERPIIAGVLMNRLRAGRKLECDATVQYALGDRRKERLTYADTEIESPYNTYLHPGLPPGPICNPGEDSIRAAMNPADVPYLYYVARADGSHVFSRTLEEHRAAKVRIRRSARK